MHMMIKPLTPVKPINRPTTLESRTAGSFTVAVTETEAWWAQANEDERYRFHVQASRGGMVVEAKGFDLEAEARHYGRILAEMLASPPDEELSPYTASDAAWWAANSPTSRDLFYVEGSPDPSDVWNNTMAAADYDRDELVATLSDDANGAFIGEGGGL